MEKDEKEIEELVSTIEDELRQEMNSEEAIREIPEQAEVPVQEEIPEKLPEENPEQKPEDRPEASSQIEKPDRTPGKSRGRSRRKNEPEGEKKNDSGRKIKLAAVCVLGAVLAAGGIYAGMSQKYKRVYFPGTEINGIDASGRTVAEVKEKIAEGISGYHLTVEGRDGLTEEIAGRDLNLRPDFNGTLEKMIAAQNPYAWVKGYLKPSSSTVETLVVFDREILHEKTAGLEFLSEAVYREPVNAAISEYIPGEGYRILPEDAGAAPDAERMEEAIADSILNLQETLSLEEAGVYREPEILSTNPELVKQAEQMNLYAGAKVTYQFGDRTEVLDGSRIHEWIFIDGDGNVGIASGQITAYVEELAHKYNTAYQERTLKTSYGAAVKIKGGTYGWKINQKAEADALAGILRAGETQTREPVYTQTAASHGANDYGNTYVEMNLTAQHLFYYVDGKLLVESDFVSGNLSKGWGTPAGVYPLNYKEKNAVLKGENYRTPVDYWMPFNGGIGMHDANWRSAFGGTIYKTGGSHGCINLPHSAAKKIFENIKSGTPILCYNLPGTEKGAKEPEESKPAESSSAESKPAESGSAESKPAESKPAESSSAESKPAESKPAESGSEESKPAESKPEESKPAETKPAETKAPSGPSEDKGPAVNGPGSEIGGPQTGGPSGPGAGPVL